ncbi:hypothetical protein [Amycolatopsis sp. H20-H5]|uniref:hypothetical protein n=1 Tax=Amycolatopsis sp. H20-H5 TaxID=3046309 RepID=UPI002DB5C588|nr:hypothetical protein [Amycolatopsis sp. H20-H5]MEC3982012.1 hypothetical protein [Amycolatopsis sp. H20-H5]
MLGDGADLVGEVAVLVTEVRLSRGERAQERGGVVIAESFAELGEAFLRRGAEVLQDADLSG